MNCKAKCFHIHYLDFGGKSVIKYWREGSLASARSRALNQGNCREVLTIGELTQEQYSRQAVANRKTTQFLRNTSR
jgi:hypothetical protein